MQTLNFEQETLESGLKIVTIPVANTPIATLMVLVRAGSKYETKEINGISHFLEHMMFKGTNKRPDSSGISEEMDSIGAEFNAFTGAERTYYYAKAGSEDFDLILDVISDIYLNSLFDDKEISLEKGVILEEIKRHKKIFRLTVLLFLNSYSTAISQRGGV